MILGTIATFTAVIMLILGVGWVIGGDGKEALKILGIWLCFSLLVYILYINAVKWFILSFLGWT
jgi:hypothetical protein